MPSSYDALFRRIEASFRADELSVANIQEWLQGGDSNDLIDIINLTKVFIEETKKAQTIEELNQLKRNSRSLVIHRDEVLDLIDERTEEIRIEMEEQTIALSIAIAEDFAEEKGIELDEKTVAQIETFKSGERRIVIREKGRFKAWKRL